MGLRDSYCLSFHTVTTMLRLNLFVTRWHVFVVCSLLIYGLVLLVLTVQFCLPLGGTPFLPTAAHYKTRVRVLLQARVGVVASLSTTLHQKIGHENMKVRTAVSEGVSWEQL